MKKRVLIVDDCADLLMVLEHVLPRLGCEVLAADSGAAALETLETEAAIDLALIDYHMPGLCGDELLEIVRTRFPEIHVVVMTAAVKAVQTDVPILKKPFTIEEIRAVVEEGVLFDALSVSSGHAAFHDGATAAGGRGCDGVT